MNFERHQELTNWLHNALLASVFVEPESPGLTHGELLELGTQRGFGPGELRDLLRNYARNVVGQRYVPEEHVASYLLIGFHDTYERDPRSMEAFSFVLDAFEDARRMYGEGSASIPRGVLVERGAAAGIERTQVQVAIASYLLAGVMTAKGESLNARHYITPEEMRAQPGGSDKGVHPAAAELPAVQDICGRRTDGRPASSDPFRAFDEKMGDLGYPDHRIWWRQTAGELAQLNPQTTPTAALVLAAALAEGALTFLVKRAQALSSGKAFAGNTFALDKKWHLDHLVSGARHPSAAIITGKLADDCTKLNDQRNRIHAGKFISQPNTPVHLDIKPHEAEQAKVTAQRVVVSILEWLATTEAAASAQT